MIWSAYFVDPPILVNHELSGPDVSPVVLPEFFSLCLSSQLDAKTATNSSSDISLAFLSNSEAVTFLSDLEPPSQPNHLFAVLAAIIRRSNAIKITHPQTVVNNILRSVLAPFLAKVFTISLALPYRPPVILFKPFSVSCFAFDCPFFFNLSAPSPIFFLARPSTLSLFKV